MIEPEYDSEDMHRAYLEKQNAELKRCLRDLLHEPRRSAILISRKHGPLTEMRATFLKGQVLDAIKLISTDDNTDIA